MRHKFLSALLACFIAVFCFVICIYDIRKTQTIADLKELNTATGLIVSNLTNAFSYADILELAIQSNNGDFSDEKFLELSNMALKQNTCIDSFQLAPDAVITLINPLEGNEEALRHDLMADDSRRASVLEAIASDSVVMQGPVESVQGRTLVFGRKAIRVNGEFWGLAIISVDFETLLEICELSAESLPFDYSISVYDSNDTLTYVWGNQNLLDISKIYADVQLSGERWRITTYRPKTFYTLVQDYGLALLFSILLGIAIYMISQYCIQEIYSAKTDHLTKTLNRSEFQQIAARKLRDKKQQCVLLAIDLDKFKYINDTYGHLAGDEVLISTAQRMQTAVRDCDLISRAGGDEYTILLCRIQTQEQLISIMNRLRELVEQEIRVGDHCVSVGLSIGYAIAPEEGSDYISLYRIADKRMYEDKMMRNAVGR